MHLHRLQTVQAHPIIVCSRSTHPAHPLLAMLMLLAMFGSPGLIRPPVALAAGSVIYVNASATIGTNTGSSWANAYTSLQTALTVAVASDQIWVAAGTYTPGILRSATFTLKNGVAIYGGFAGTETLLSQRNWTTNSTTLSGEIGVAGPSDNSYHVVTGGGTDATAILDGLTISGGNANSDPNDLGGGVYNLSSSPTLANVTISGNIAKNGGGMYNFSSSPTLTNVIFSGNEATYAGIAEDKNGGGMYNTGSNPTLTSVTFSGNIADISGGGMYNTGSNPTLTSVTFSDNSAQAGGGMLNDTGSNPTLTNVTISGNSAETGGGIANTSSSPTLTNVTISGNSAESGGGGMSNDTGSNPTLTNVTISGNTSVVGGGGITNNTGSSPTLTNVTISGNSGGMAGGGMFNGLSSNPKLTNVIISGNSAENGGGMANAGSPTLTNVTISGNRASTTGGGMYNENSSPQIRNSIVWGNSGTQIFNDTSTPVVSFSIVQGGYAGTGNLNADPLFVTPISATSAPTTTGNLRLTPVSPAINAGNKNVANPGLPAIDLAGNPRIIGVTVDMGAYEFDSIDTIAPDTTIDSSPANPSTSTTATFTFSSVGGSTFACRLDGAAFAPCTSPQEYTDLTSGSHTFDVRATDAAGNTDATPASYSWTIAYRVFLPIISTRPDTV